MPLVSIIVVNWNGMQFLDDCLASLKNQIWCNREFIIVDNGSSDGSAERILSWAKHVSNARGICLPANRGFCEANNLAFAQARGEWIALLNSDAIADPNWIEELVRSGDRENRIGMIGGKILFAEPRGVIDKVGHLIYWDGQNCGRGTGERDTGQYDREEEILWPDGCAALYHRDVFEETGGFDESFFAFGDDADLGMRARLLGWKALYVPKAVVRHRHSATAGAYSPLKAMLVERNRLLLAVKNFPLPLLLMNPYWSILRFAWHACAVFQNRGSAGKFVAAQGWLPLLRVLARAHINAWAMLPAAMRNRRTIQKTKKLDDREIMDLLRRFHVNARELALIV
jgi:GT2 family glycosyltransferase